jgi:hypothetical protein
MNQHGGAGGSGKGIDVDTVLGLSLTPTSLGLVLVEGQVADGATLDSDLLDASCSDHIGAAAARARDIAAGGVYRLDAVGMTWSDDAAGEATLLHDALAEFGFDNVAAVPLAEASKALACGIADVVGYRTTAVCVIELESVFVVVVDTRLDSAETHSQVVTGVDESVRWLAQLLDREGLRPDGVVIVGSGADVDAVASGLQAALPLPVFVPTEGQLALARGAAVVAALTPGITAMAGDFGPAGRHRRGWALPQAGMFSVLVAAVVTFVVSVSLVVGLKLTGATEATPVVRPQTESAAAQPPAAPLPAAEVPVISSPTPAAVPPQTEVLSKAAPVPAPQVVDPEPAGPPPAPAPAEAPAAAPAAPPAQPPLYPAAQQAPVRRGIKSWIMEHMPGVVHPLQPPAPSP